MFYPCPACGFEVLEDSVGSYDICPICGWEDDGVQLRFPSMRGGANGECLYEWQQKVIKDLPLDTSEAKGFYRDKLWRPITIEECQNLEHFPKTAFEYFLSIDEQIPDYYWRK